MKVLPQASCLALVGLAHLAPPAVGAPSQRPQPQLVLHGSTSPLPARLSAALQGLFAPLGSLLSSSAAGPHGDASPATAAAALGYDASDKTIYDVITTDERFSQLARAVRYSSDETKQLLNGSAGVEGLTIFAPVNWHKERHGDGGGEGDHVRSEAFAAGEAAQSLSAWSMLDRQIDELEAAAATSASTGHDGDDGDDDDDDDERRRKRQRLAHFIDAVLAYHLVDSSSPLLSTALIQNSSVATRLSITGKAASILGDLNGGQPLRIRVGKALVPPGVFLNLYSPVVHPDVRLKNGVLHAVKYPLFQPPSILQGLFWAQPAVSTLTSALQKVGAEGYLALPVPHWSHRGGHDDDGSSSPMTTFTAGDPKQFPFAGLSESHKHRHPHDGHDGHAPFSSKKGTPASTLFIPSNLAWDALPWAFRAYLFSPWGESLLGKILMLHSLPRDVFYADAVHHVGRRRSKEHGGGGGGGERGGEGDESTEVAGTTETLDVGSSSGEWARLAALYEGHGHGHESLTGPPPGNKVNVTHYVFDSVLSKLRRKRGDGDTGAHSHSASATASASSAFEQVHVQVHRFHPLPLEQGPRQTRTFVQGVPVVLGDIPHLNGATHVLNRFIMPEGHPRGHASARDSGSARDGARDGAAADADADADAGLGLWEEVRREAERMGFGRVSEGDMARMGAGR